MREPCLPAACREEAAVTAAAAVAVAARATEAPVAAHSELSLLATAVPSIMFPQRAAAASPAKAADAEEDTGG